MEYQIIVSMTVGRYVALRTPSGMLEKKKKKKPSRRRVRCLTSIQPNHSAPPTGRGRNNTLSLGKKRGGGGDNVSALI